MNNKFFYFFLFSFYFFNQICIEKEKSFPWIAMAAFSIGTTLSYEIIKKLYNTLIAKNIHLYNVNSELIKLQNISNNNNAPVKITPKNNQPSQYRILANELGVSSEIKWSEVCLSSAVKNELLEYAKAVFTQYNKSEIILPNILCLYGLPGTNKTSVVKGLSNELNIPLLIIDPNLLEESIYNKISMDNILDHAKQKGMCIVHIKNIERMSKNFFFSCAKYLKTGLSNSNILLTFSSNNDFLIKDLCLNKNKYIKFTIVDTPKYEERFRLIKYILSLYQKFVNVNNIDIHYITNLLSSCTQKDIYLIIEKAIEKKQLQYINAKNFSDDIFSELSEKGVYLKNNDILAEFKFFKKQDTIVTGEGDSHLNTGLHNVEEFIIETPKVTFNEVIGLEHIKKELKFISDYLKDMEKFQEANIRMPKGILFMGPPGCGKTLMARAIAGEAGVTVIVINGSDFIDKYVGQGARKVRELFEIAKIYGPTIIFIDEIDAIGGKRSSNADGGEKEYTQTLNALLTEMDGFTSTNNNIIVIASTNRNIEELDSALMRRFEEKYNFPHPTYKDRLKILELYLKDVTISYDVSLESIAMKTISFSGAELEHLVNQAKYIAINRILESGKSLIDFEITASDMTQSYNTMCIGYEILNSSIDKKELFKTAVHEAGHSICMLLQKNYPYQFELVTITPRDCGDGTVLGFAQNFQKEEFKCDSKENLEQMIIVSFGGQVAEELIFNEIYNGVSSDLHHASKIARAMVTQFGMVDNLLYTNNSGELSLLEREAIEKILKECKEKCKQLLLENKHLLKILAENLLIKKTLTRNEVMHILQLY